MLATSEIRFPGLAGVVGYQKDERYKISRCWKPTVLEESDQKTAVGQLEWQSSGQRLKKFFESDTIRQDENNSLYS